jgi:hypothetical protein
MFWNQTTTQQTPEECFGMRIQHTRHLRNILESKHKTSKPEKYFGIRTQYTKHLRNVLESEQNTTNTRGMFWNENTRHQTPKKYFVIKTQHIKT